MGLSDCPNAMKIRNVKAALLKFIFLFEATCKNWFTVGNSGFTGHWLDLGGEMGWLRAVDVKSCGTGWTDRLPEGCQQAEDSAMIKSPENSF